MFGRPLVGLLVVGFLAAGCSGSGDDAGTASSSSLPSEAAAEGVSDRDDEVDGWDPVLASTRAGVAPPLATCPAGTDPDMPGPIGQDRPEPGKVSNTAATFDRHQGRVIYVDTAGETWTFDVCTNTWTAMNAARWPGGTAVVYDVDSDVTVGFGPDGHVSVYDVDTNTWNGSAARPTEPVWWAGVIYDPISGLIIYQGGDSVATLNAYDVESDTWTLVGTVEEPSSIVGYSIETDRLIRYVLLGRSGDLLDPRTGAVAPLAVTPDFGGGFGQLDFATDVDTAYVMEWGRKAICRFDPVAVDWATCFDPADGPVPRPLIGWGAMVGDPINNRLILINSLSGSEADTASDDDVWAVDLDTGQWNQLVAPSAS